MHSIISLEPLLKYKENWSYHDAALHSTSFMKMNRVMRWFTGNIGYHHIHHLNALIPFYRLPEVHKTFSEFKIVQTTSLNPWEIYRCFQVKVWGLRLKSNAQIK